MVRRRARAQVYSEKSAVAVKNSNIDCYTVHECSAGTTACPDGQMANCTTVDDPECEGGNATTCSCVFANLLPTPAPTAGGGAIEVADFASLKAAVVDKAVIKATGDIDFTECITIPEGAEVTISGATGTEKLSGGGVTRHFYIPNGTTLDLSRLTLKDGWIDGASVRGARGGRVTIPRV